MNKDKVQNQNILGTLVNKDESGIIAYSDQIYDKKTDNSLEEENVKQNERLDNAEAKDRELQSTLENITKTGEASAASNVSYNHNDSQLDASNVQQAIDEVYNKGNTNRENDKTELEKSISDNKAAVDASIQDAYKKSNYNDGDKVIDFNTIHLITDNPEFAIAAVDINNKILYGIKADGQPYWGVGVPKVVRDYVENETDKSLKKIKLDLFFFQGEWVVNTRSDSVTVKGNMYDHVGFYRLPETSDTKYISLLEETSYIISNEECLVVDISDNTLKKISAYTPNKNYIPLYGKYREERWGLLYEHVMLNKIDPLVDDMYSIKQNTLSCAKALSPIDATHFSYETGQIYGNEGSVIVNSGAKHWHHIKIEKSQNNVRYVKFKRHNKADVSYFVIYTDSNNIIKARRYPGVTEEDEIEFIPNYPNDSTRVYISSAVENRIDVHVLDDSYNVNELIYDVKNETDKEIESITNWDNICRSVCRIADGLSAPRQTLAGYKMAYDLGLRIMLCDLRFTSDNVPVLEHDDYINQLYNNVYDSNGQLVSTAEGSRVYIDQTTYADLQQYDYGLYKGESYRGTRIMSLEQMCQFAKKYGTEIYLEMKTSLTSEQVNIVISMIKGYGLWRKTTWSPQSPDAMDVVVAIEPNVYINQHSNIGSGSLTIAAIEKLHSYQNNYNEGKVTITCSAEGILPQNVANKMLEYNIGLMATTLNTQQQLLDYYNRGGYYRMFTEVLTNNLNCGKILFNNLQ